MDFDARVKLSVYGTIAETTRAPTSGDVARALDSSVAEVEAAFRRLGESRLLVLEPGSESRIRMALPFSGVATQHVVTVEGKPYFANCAWDAFGIAAALHGDADIASSCPDCGEAIGLRVEGGTPAPAEAVAHFAVPTAHWWDDIVHT